MTTPQRYTCPITGLPFVRKITFLDGTPTPPDESPWHIGQEVLFDGVPVAGVIRNAEVSIGVGGVTVVTLYADPDACTPTFRTDDNPHGYAPATIDGHVFITPRGTPWGLDGEWLRCPVYVAEVEVR